SSSSFFARFFSILGLRSLFLVYCLCVTAFFFFSSRRRHTRFKCDWSSDVCSSDLRFQLPLVDLALTGVTEEAGKEIALHVLERRSEERRVGKECRSRGGPYHYKKKKCG